jgi:dolichol-phosphate mannosyltransferase
MKEMSQHTISIIIPVHNEEKNVPALYAALQSVMAGLTQYDYEYIFVDDGSTDGSVAAICAIVSRTQHARLVEFTRNFGKELATTAGIAAAKGDAIIMIDADMQHPPSLIPALVKKWEEGSEVVVGVRTKNTNEGFIKKYGSLLYYRIMRAISETPTVRGETDYRLIDRAVADAFLKLGEHERMTRSLINWLGFRKTCVTFVAKERLHGEAAYSHIKLLRLAISTFVANSLLPLRFAGYLGMAITLLSFALGTAVFVQRYILHDFLGWNVSGPAQLAILNVFLVGITLSCLGLIALYVGRINAEVTNRPLYVVRKRKNV